MITELSKGVNGPLDISGGQTVSVTVTGSGQDVFVLPLGIDGRSIDDSTVAYYGKPSIMKGHIVVSDNSVALNLHLLPSEVTKALIIADLSSGNTWGPSQDGVVTNVSIGNTLAYKLRLSGLTTERTVIVAEVYRRGGGWKVRNVSQGHEAGLVYLLTECGIEIEDDSDEETTSEPAVAELRAPASSTPSDQVRVDMLKKLLVPPPAGAAPVDLRKHMVAAALHKNGVLGLTARVVIVFDHSQSAHRLYKPGGAIHRLLQRLVPVASPLAVSATLDAFAFGTRARALPLITEANMAGYLESGSVKDGLKVGWHNVEPRVKELVYQRYVLEAPSDTPTLVIFISDGGIGVAPEFFFGDVDQQIRDFLGRKVRDENIFWNFFGIGEREGYGEVARLARAPHVGFFSVDDFDQITDEELYRRIVEKFARWVNDRIRQGKIRPIGA
jgi:stress response protein SCP2